MVFGASIVESDKKMLNRYTVSLAAVLTLLLVFVKDGWQWCILILGIVIGNLLLLKLDVYTAASDRQATAIKIPTGGWGADPNDGWIAGRLRIDRELKKE